MFGWFRNKDTEESLKAEYAEALKVKDCLYNAYLEVSKIPHAPENNPMDYKKAQTAYYKAEEVLRQIKRRMDRFVERHYG